MKKQSGGGLVIVSICLLGGCAFEPTSASAPGNANQAPAPATAVQALPPWNEEPVTEIEKHRTLIGRKISLNWVQPPASRKGLQSLVRVRCAASGDVLMVSTVRSSGDSKFDGAVRRAVYKASPLPLPKDPQLAESFRDIEFLFGSKD